MVDVIDKANADYERWLSEKTKSKILPPNDIKECVGCGKPIGDKRKKVLPHALRCIVCQQTFEAKINTKGKR